MKLDDIMTEIRDLRDEIASATSALETIARDLPDISAALKVVADFVSPPSVVSPSAKFSLSIQPPDSRDIKFQNRHASIPEATVLNVLVKNTGALATCAVSAVAAVATWESGKPFPSRLLMYYVARDLACANISEDTGTCIRDACRALATSVPETMYVYDESKFADIPPRNVLDAVKDLGISYLAVPQTQDDITACLASMHPVICGLRVFDHMTRGNSRPPGANDTELGWSAVVITGYDTTTKQFSVILPSAPDQTLKVPFSVVLDESLATDFWTLRA